MEGRRISASPRPCSGRRVVAKKRPLGEGFVNSVKKLQRREIRSKRDRAFSMSNAQERFRNMRLTVSVNSDIFVRFEIFGFYQLIMDRVLLGTVEPFVLFVVIHDVLGMGLERKM